jgi:predicted Rossmann fold nucleotide-binding protein DprA/Smf involved in DNA uptake
MRVAIVGSRRYPELERVGAYVDALPRNATLVTGSASGVDAAATEAARRRGLPVIRVAASFEEVSDPRRSAERNQRLIDQAEVLVAFWDGASAGTRGTIERALDSGREVHVFTSSGRPNMGG